jgi:hypothetical protein
VTDLFSAGVGGGIATFAPNATALNTTISGNHASTSDNDIDGHLTQ